MVIDIYSLLSEPLAKSLGLFQDEPVFVSLSYEKSSTPLVSCTQRQSPGFGVKNHLKGVFDHFFDCWNNDREKLKKVGRPPQGFVAASEAVAASAGSGGNDNNKPAAAVAAAAAPPVITESKEKRSWWSTWFGGQKTTAELVLVTEDAVKVCWLCVGPL